MHMPPENCPNDVISESLPARIRVLEDSQGRHDAALERIGRDLDTVKKEVHEIRVTMRERDGQAQFLRTVFLTLLGLFVSGVIAMLAQIGVTVYYAGRMAAKLDHVILMVEDHEARIRAEEKKP
jgi:hypothetical protein